jgi:hypothetical protein
MNLRCLSEIDPKNAIEKDGHLKKRLDFYFFNAYTE